jgi:lipoate-protein ligase B
VTFHGVALNVAPHLEDFELIDPCGMPGVASTSIARELGRSDLAPTTEAVAGAAAIFARALAKRLGATISGDLPAAA